MLDLPYLAREIWMRLARLIYWPRRDARFIVILGAPGAGKGTISSMLSEKTGLPHLNMGNLFRREIANNTAIGKKWGPVVKAGRLVPDKVSLKLLRAELCKHEYCKGAILDGFPRTLGQARRLRSMLTWWGNKVNRVVLLDVSVEDVLERLSQRKSCACGKTYHATMSPPKVANTCDACGKPLFTRDDDKPEVVRERMRVFDNTFGPLCDFYEAAGLLTRVETNNTKSTQDVLTDVVFTIEEFD